VAYHDDEWGRPLRGVTAMFERLSLEGFQSGCPGWSSCASGPRSGTAFAGFEPAAVARFDDADVERLLADAGIVRKPPQDRRHGGQRAARCWSSTPRSTSCSGRSRPAGTGDRPRWTTSRPSARVTAMAKELKRRGLRFVGPTTCYALMQAAGLVDDHVQTCWRATAERDTPPG
jgi:DNA-3-methyladenine glycosylase I